MIKNHLLLSLSPNRATDKSGWHSRNSVYDDQYIELIQDPAAAAPKRLVTAIPSPFARLHLFDTAFHLASDQLTNKTDSNPNSVFHRAVSDCLDVLELLFRRSSHSTILTLEKWVPAVNLPSLQNSSVDGHRLLASTLSLFLTEDGKTANFDKQPFFYLLLAHNRLIGLSSPLTLFVSSPAAALIAENFRLRNPKTNRPYFSEVRPLHIRDDDFQKYLHWMFGQNASLRADCSFMYNYLARSLERLDATNPEFAETIRGFSLAKTTDLGLPLEPLIDSDGHSVTVLGAQLYDHGRSRLIEELQNSLFALRSKRLPQGSTLSPIVLRPQHSSLGKFDGKTEIPLTNGQPLDQRVLPDSNVQYPFLLASDLIEDRIIRLPFRMNADRFICPKYKQFTPDDQWSYLPPLKPAFFDYFDPPDIPDMCRFIRSTTISDQSSVDFEIDIPTKGGMVTLRKAFNTNPQARDHGLVVNALVNCAVYPCVVVREHANLSDKYWVMLVDAELGPGFKTKECFDLQFFKIGSNGAAAPIGKERNASIWMTKTARSKKDPEASSYYYTINGGPFDYAILEAFSFDRNQSARGLIIPKWRVISLGTKSASIAIDFGTTNTHVAWTPSDGRPLPKVLSISQDDLQTAILSAPRLDAPSESARFDKFPARLVGFSLRLHHEFLPSIIGGSSPFKFPLRTATSELPGIKPGSYSLLENLNISFIFGLEPHAKDEEISTDLKWSVRASDEVRGRVREFVRELLILVRTKLILNGIDPHKCKIVWFKPLSFDTNTRTLFEKIWSDAFSEIFHAKSLEGRLLCLTESEAPYYYHEQTAQIVTAKPVLCVDIGGGSTDVVVFQEKRERLGEKTPQFGTSFSFAGNALWGSGYSRINSEQTGVVREYGSWVEERIGHIQDEELMRNVAGVYRELNDSSAGSEEYLNFFFSIDKQIGFTEKLSLDPWVKCLVLVHYLAIVYHCAQVMRALGLEPPKFVCLSGRGSQSVNILDPRERKAQIAALTHSVFEFVFGAKVDEPIEIKMAPNSKEATCDGGVLKVGGASAEPKSVVSIGDGSVASEESQRKSYAEIVSDASILDGVVANISKFAKMIVQLNSEIGFRDKFGIDIDVGRVASTIEDNVRQYIVLGLERHGYTEDPSEKINETLFFYPLIQKLFELGKNVTSSVVS
jgi:hypothetical protein